MTDQQETADERLERLTQATAGIRARSGFTERVMLAAQAASAPGWLESAALSAKAVFAVAVLTAAAAVTLAVQSDLATTEASAAAYTAMEIDW